MIYIDLLIIINLYITFFLLKAAATFLHIKITNKRMLLGSLVGGASSLIILLPPLPFVLNAIIKIIIGALIVLASFGFNTKIKDYIQTFLKNVIVFVIINVIFAGFTLMLWFFVAPFDMEYNNGFSYFNISFTALLATTALSYGVIKLIRYFLDFKNLGDREFTVTIISKESETTLPAIADSGNMLIDVFSGKYVIICPKSKMIELELERHYIPRMLTYNTIDSTGLISCYNVDKVIIKSPALSDKNVEALIGVSDNDSPAIFNPKLLI